MKVPDLASQRSWDWRREASRIGSIVVISTADYNAPLWTNKQQVASRLSTAVPLIYVESLGLRAPRFTRSDTSRMFRRLTRYVQARSTPHADADTVSTTPGPLVLSPLVVPWHFNSRVRSFNARLFRRQIDKHLANLPGPRILWIYSPLAVDLLDFTQFTHSLYHCVDDLSSVPGVSARIVNELEGRLVPEVDMVVASSPHLAYRCASLGGRVYLHHNVVDGIHFADAVKPGSIPYDVERIPPPRAVFMGSLADHKLDWDLLDRLAGMAQSWSFVLIGPVADETRQTGVNHVRRRSNVHVLGYRPYRTLPAYLRACDAALLPYRLTAHTKAIFPLKVLEYRAAGLPVLSTRLPALAASSAVTGISFAASAAEFHDALTRLPARGSRRRADPYAMDQSWEALLGRVLHQLTRLA